MNSGKKIIIVSNRLPIKIYHKDGELSYQKSEGGLATGLGSIYRQGKNVWIGWPGAVVENELKEKVSNDLLEENLCPIFLSQEEINDFYEGFSNEMIWPLFHYFPTYASYNPQYWNAYNKVNRKFADAISKIASKDDVIWIHDYQLMLVPALVRDKLPEVSIGFFQHIPFPSYEIFRLLPWRNDLLNGLLGADVIGFHTYDDVRHFISSINRISGINNMANEFRVDNRMVIVDAFPISIDYKKYRSLAEDSNTRRNERKLRQLTNHNRLIISIDRLDYSKGIIQRLKAYQLFLENHRELHGKVTMIQLVVPSRDTVAKYKELKEEMNRMVSEINGRFSTLGWQPIQHFYRSFPIHLLSALYKVADVALVTPMRDGMNLVSKEYVASKTDHKGVLVLSEMAGASRELSDAVIVNPNDIWDFSEKIFYALNMPDEEQRKRMTAMQQIVSKFDIFTWVKNFMDKLEDVKTHQQALLTRSISPAIRQKISISYFYGGKRLIFLDYDGTLVPFNNNILAAVPDEDLLQLLKELCADNRNKVVITSGRDYQTLEKWIGQLPVDIIAEHGAWYKDQGKFWRSKKDLNNEWKQEIFNIMNQFSRKTPGASIEEKSYSLAWHYRKVEDGLGNLRAHELTSDLKHFLSDQGLQMLQGDKVIEVKSMSVNKGKATKRWLEKDSYDFVMAIGDDLTDEDIFKSMPEDAITIKVGTNISEASYYLNSYQEVRQLIRDLINTPSSMPDHEDAILKEAS